MNRKTKIIYILGSVLFGALAVISLYFGLIASGVITVQKPKIIIASGSATEEYTGSAVSNGSWKLVSGQLDEGHVLEVKVSGQQTAIGSSSNLFTVVVKDKNGRDVTSEYAIEYQPGDLVVNKRELVITTDSVDKTYDGTPLTIDDEAYTLTKGSLLKNHFLYANMTGEIIDAGTTEAKATFTVKDIRGNDVTSYYDINVVPGSLTVNPLEITIKTGSASKIYDGIELTCDDYKIISLNQLLEGHTLDIAISGSITEVGTAQNTVAQILISDSEGEDVTSNYKITIEPGSLIVQGVLPEGGFGSGTGLDMSGKIGGGGGGPATLAFKILSPKDDTVYLRYFNYTDYDGRSWSNPTDPYKELIDETYSANYLTSLALESAGGTKQEVQVEMFTRNYLLPYYMALGDYDYDKQTSDVLYEGNYSEKYSLDYYRYNYIYDPSRLEDVDLGEHSYYELAYRTHVYEKYLGVPETSANYLNKLIESKAFSKDDPNIIGRVAEYIQNAAKYNKSYNPELDAEEDIMVAFLDKYKEGICQHYALSATMLYRQLGIPARYTIGYMAQTVANEWVEVSTNNAHAWVEVYIDGAGWVYVEVTGASSEDEESLGEFTVRVRPYSVNIKTKEIVTAKDLDYVIEGFDEFAKKGYTCKVELSGRQIGVGISESSVKSVVVRDPDGFVVTDRFLINKYGSFISIYEREIILKTESFSKSYDGTPLRSSGEGFSIISGELLSADHYIVVDPLVSITDVGRVRNLVSAKVFNRVTGADETYRYNIVVSAGWLTVSAQRINIVAGSDTKVYDGTALTCNEYTLYNADWQVITSLGEGVTIDVTISGSQVELGRCDNVIVKIVIKDAKGREITSFYEIGTVNGKLEVTP